MEFKRTFSRLASALYIAEYVYIIVFMVINHNARDTRAGRIFRTTEEGRLPRAFCKRAEGVVIAMAHLCA